MIDGLKSKWVTEVVGKIIHEGALDEIGAKYSSKVFSGTTFSSTGFLLILAIGSMMLKFLLTLSISNKDKRLFTNRFLELRSQ